MDTLRYILSKIFIFEKEPQKIGLSQLKTQPEQNKNKNGSIKTKEIKLSDLMRRAG